MITNNTFLSGRIHRGMRASLAESFSQATVVNLHGSGKVSVLGDAGATDENVFDILQGVSIAILGRSQAPSHVGYAELVGRRQDKYDALASHALLTCESLRPAAPYFLWIPRAGVGGDEFEGYTSLGEIFGFKSVSGKPGDDELLVSLRRDDVLAKLERFRAALQASEPPRLTEAGRNLAARPSAEPFDQGLVIPYAYRPFDTRYTYYDPKIWTRAVKPLKSCVDGEPILLTTKLVKDAAFSHVFVTRQFADVIFLSNTSSVNCYSFPTSTQHDDGGLGLGRDAPFSNVSVGTAADRVGRSVDGSELFAYVYAVLYSPFYRDRYYEQLQYDFPRIPLPPTTALLEELGRLGSRLIELHLGEGPSQDSVSASYDRDVRAWRFQGAGRDTLPLPTFVGDEKPVVGRVGWSDNAVWIDAEKPTRGAANSAVDGTMGFKGVPEEVWTYRVGGYQVCEKWLKDRKGQTLSGGDITQYRMIIVALAETIRLMDEIDAVIERHGGWPAAFGDL